jgi:sulfatase maturation enzyme AslB (radical SAM superfamily)
MFDPLLPSIRILEFYGGEPTLISNHRLLLQKLIDNNNAKDIKLHYNTNGTNFSNELVELWQHFKEVDLAFSIDDIGNRFEYQRSGANWEDVNRNLDQYLNLPRSIHKFSLFVTVNIQNVLYLPELLDWFDTKTFDTFHINALEQPKHFNIQYLNRYTKDIIIKKIKESAHIDRLTGIVKILSGDNLIKTDFANHIKEIDKIRSENFADSHPEMADIIGYVL